MTFLWSVFCEMRQVTYTPYHIFPKTTKKTELFTQATWVRPVWGRSCAQSTCHYSQKALITAGMTCKDCCMSWRIHSQWRCSADSWVAPYNTPFKEMSSFMVPSTHSKSTPLRSLQLKHTTKPRGPISDVLFSQSVPPSISLIVCLSFGEKKPTCVSTLSWHGCLSPTVQATGSHKAGHPKQLRRAGCLVFGVWPPSWEVPYRKHWLNATFLGK